MLHYVIYALYINMATSTELYTELNKLKKEVLIEIILNRCVPNGINVSPELRRVIGGGDRDGVLEFDSEVGDLNLEADARIIRLESDIKVLKAELKCTQYVISKLEGTIKDKENIIDLLGNQNNRNRDTSEAKCGVARSTRGTEIVGSISASAEVDKKKILQRSQVRNQLAGVIVGSKETSSMTSKAGEFSAAVSKAWLHIGKVGRGTSEQIVLQHLKANFPNESFTVGALPVRDDANSVSFKVGADMRLLNELTRPEIWPKGVTVKRFRFFRQGSLSGSQEK